MLLTKSVIENYELIEIVLMEGKERLGILHMPNTRAEISLCIRAV